MVKRLLYILLLLCALPLRGEDTRQGCLDRNFRTLEVYAIGTPRPDVPVIDLNNPAERIVVEFDELASDRRYLRYSLEHCDASWQPEGLVDSEFLDGFNEGIVEDYDYSRATIVHYVHYAIAVPNEQVRITQPGNYLLKVYDESEPDETLLQARFGVTDNSAGVSATVTTRTDIDSNASHQQLGIRVDTRHLNLADPFTDLRVVITQNGRPDSEVTLVTPQRLGREEVIYEHLRPLIFEAGNVYRRFETVTDNYPGIGVESIDREAPVINFYLYPDEPRATSPHSYDLNLRGSYVVRSSLTDRPATEADYGLVHFTLPTAPIAGYDIFLDGDLTDRRFGPESRMVYNHATGAYEASLLLKQGAYSYQYLAVPSGSGSMRGETSPVEGDKYQTDNEYTVRVYHRPKGSRFDRLAGYTTLRAE